jgi:hypothetical protein
VKNRTENTGNLNKSFMKPQKAALSSSVTRQLTAYAALGVAGAVSSNSAQAAVILNGGSITETVTGLEWEVDLNGGGAEITLTLDPTGGFLYPLEPGPKPLLTATGGTAPTAAKIAGLVRGVGYNQYRYAQKFGSKITFGDSITLNASSVWAGKAVTLRDGSGFTNSRWAGDRKSGFLGIKFDIGGFEHYGFVEVNIPNGDNKPAIGVYGYNDQVGDVPTDAFTLPPVNPIPEPTSLSLLALGATGLTLLRRSRKQS